MCLMIIFIIHIVLDKRMIIIMRLSNTMCIMKIIIKHIVSRAGFVTN